MLLKGNGIDIEDIMVHGIIAASSIFSSADGKFKTLEDVEKEYIKTVLRDHHGNRSKAAKILGIDRKTLWTKIK